MMKQLTIAIALLCATFAFAQDKKPKLSDLINKNKDIAPASLKKASGVTKFKSTGSRLSVKAFCENLTDDKDNQKVFEEFLNEQIGSYEKQAEKGGYSNDVGGAFAQGILLIYAAKTDTKIDEGVLPTLVKQCQALLDSEAMTKATDKEKQQFYESMLCMGYFADLMSSAAENADDKKISKSIADAYWKGLFGDIADKVSIGEAGLEIAE